MLIKGDPKVSMAADMVAGAQARLALAVENFWRVMCMRRPPNCRCKGCKMFRLLPERLHESARGVIMCAQAFIAWEVEIANLVTTEGKNDLLTNYLKGSAYTAAFYVGLVTSTGFTAYAAGDTAAQIVTTTPSGGNNQWQESTAYSNSTRQAWTGGSASAGSIDNSASKAVFNINATDTIRGAFMDTNSTKGGTSGKLYGEADFGAARSVLNGDTLNVQVTCTV